MLFFLFKLFAIKHVIKPFTHFNHYNYEYKFENDYKY